MKTLTRILTVAILSFSLVSAGFTAEDKEMLKDHIMKKDGKVMVVKDGKSTAATEVITMTDGTKVMPDGAVTMKDGMKSMLKDGEMMTMDGKMMTGDMKMGH